MHRTVPWTTTETIGAMYVRRNALASMIAWAERLRCVICDSKLGKCDHTIDNFKGFDVWDERVERMKNG